MIARQWIGETLELHADIYGKYLEETGVKDIRATKGNQGVWLMRRVRDGRAEFMVISTKFLLDFVCDLVVGQAGRALVEIIVMQTPWPVRSLPLAQCLFPL
jgi:hypothetical protein